MAAARANQEEGAGELEEDAGGEEGAAPEEELDAVEVFKECHTSRKKGLSDPAKEAIVSLISTKKEFIRALKFSLSCSMG